MPKIYAVIQADGKPKGFYPDDVYEEDQIPIGAIEVTEEDWHDYIENQLLRKFHVDGSIIVLPPLTEEELEEQRKAAPKTPLQLAEEKIVALTAENNFLQQRASQSEDNQIVIMEALINAGLL